MTTTTHPSAVERLAAIRALVDAATPGPWGLEGPMTGEEYWCVCEHHNVTTPDPAWPGHPTSIATGATDADAAFIAASRIAMPLLLAVADAAAEMVKSGAHDGDCDNGELVEDADGRRWERFFDSSCSIHIRTADERRAVLRDALAALEATR